MNPLPSAPLRVALLSMHTDPLGPLGGEHTGGMNVYVRELAAAVSEMGIPADVFTRATNPRLHPVEEIAPGARLIRITAGPRRPIRKENLFPYAEAFAGGVDSFARGEGIRYGVVSANYWLSGVAGERLSRKWEVPMALRFHTTAAQKNDALPAGNGHEPQCRAWAEAGLARRTDTLIASTPDEAGWLEHHLGARPERICVIPPGVNLERFAPAPRARARALLGWSPDAFTILCVGRVEPVKGLDRLMEALCGLKERQPGLPFELVIVGGTIKREAPANPRGGYAPVHFASPRQREEVRRVRQLAEKLGVGRAVRFIGAQPQRELPRMYSAADVLAIPSRYESFGMVALEAAACALPAVAFRVGGLPQAVGEGGLLIADGDTGAFSEALLQLAKEPALGEELGRRAQRRVQAFSWSLVAEREIDLWNRLRRAGSPAVLFGPKSNGKRRAVPAGSNA